MAEVFGNIGDQPVELNNAATEATLKALLTVAKAQFDKDTKDPKTLKAQRDLEKSLANLAKQTQTYSRTVSTLTSEKENYTRSIRDSRKANQQQTLSVKNVAVGAAVLAKAVVNVTSKFVTLISDISDVGDSLTSAAGLFRNIPLGLGDLIAPAAQALASATEKTQKAFIDAASVGANFSGSMEEMINSASAAGLTVDQFTGIISRNGEALALLSATTADGARRFAQLGKAMRNSDVQNQLANLGFNTQEINEGMLRYSNLLAKAGTDVRNMVPEELVALTGHYYRNLSAVSQLTGESRKALEDEAIARQRDSRSRILESRLDDTSRETYRAMILSVAQEHRGAAEEIILGMGLQSDGAKAFAALAPDTARAFDELGRNITRTGELSESTASSVYDVYSNEARRFNSEKGFRDLLGGPLQDTYGVFTVAMMDVAARGDKTLNEAFTEVSETAAKRGRELGEIDPSDILKAQQQVAEMSNTALRFLAKQTDLLTWSLGYMASKVTDVIGALDNAVSWSRKVFGDDRTEIEKERDKIQAALTRARQSVEMGEGSRDEAKEKELEDQLRVLNAQVANQSVTLSPEEQHRQEETARQQREIAEKQEKLDKEILASQAQQTEATEEQTRATQNLTRETKKASSCELDYSSPQALFNSFAKIMVGGQPGVTDAISGASVSDTTADVASVAAAAVNGIILPAAGVATSLFGMREHPVTGREQFHSGVDIAASLGTDILAPEGGTARVKKQLDAAGNLTGWGNYIEIVNEQDQVIHRLAHLAEATIKDGERVLAGQMIGKMGSTGTSTGSHLHWEMYQDGKRVDPLKAMGLSVSKGQMVTPSSAQSSAAMMSEPQFVSPPDTDKDGVSYTRPITPTNPAAEITPGTAQTSGGGITPTPSNQPGAPLSPAMNSSTSQLDDLNNTMTRIATLTQEHSDLYRKMITAINNLNDVV